MVTMMVEDGQVSVPAWVKDLTSFRRWAHSDDFPEHGRTCFLSGEVWIDISKEQLYTHTKLKGEISRVLGTIVKLEKLGDLFPDGALLSSVDAGFASKPDATFVSAAALIDKVRLIESRDEGYVELEGAPDMVLEVVSKSSVHKDTVLLRQAYWEAGILEYWLVDGRRTPCQFDIFRHTARGYVATRKQDGWIKSTVFGRSFRLVQEQDARGNPEFTLEMR
jgi:Uma2 family endonuclease